MLHLPSYSRGGERIQQKATISGHLQRESLLNENRKARPCHTLHTSAARICTPEGVKSATHAQRRNSCRSGACPNVQIQYPCRLRRRQGPPKKPAIITARPESGLVRLNKPYASQPHAGAPATTEGKRRNRDKTPERPLPVPLCVPPSKNRGPRGPTGLRGTPPSPCPITRLSYYSL